MNFFPLRPSGTGGFLSDSNRNSNEKAALCLTMRGQPFNSEWIDCTKSPLLSPKMDPGPVSG